MSYLDHVPDESAWYGYEGDLDAKWLHDLFYGKSIGEVQEYFGENHSIERASELLFVPTPVFQYYVQAFAAYVLSERARGDPDSASPFLGLLLEREKRDPGSVSKIYETLAPAVDFVANNQEHFDANTEIYGDFKERAQVIRSACGA